MRLRSLIVGFTLGLATQTCPAQSMSTLDTLQKSLELTPDPSHGRHTYAEHCVACHRRDGWGNGKQAIPELAGQQDAYLLEQLLQFSTGERRNAAMHALIKRPEFTQPQTLRDLSVFLSNQPLNPRAEHGNGARLSVGERVYRESCAICHGSTGAGAREDLIPAIGGQHYRYLLVRLRHFSQDHGPSERGSLEPAVINVLSGLSASELAAVADYTSRLPALQSR